MKPSIFSISCSILVRLSDNSDGRKEESYTQGLIFGGRPMLIQWSGTLMVQANQRGKWNGCWYNCVKLHWQPTLQYSICTTQRHRYVMPYLCFTKSITFLQAKAFQPPKHHPWVPVCFSTNVICLCIRNVRSNPASPTGLGWSLLHLQVHWNATCHW